MQTNTKNHLQLNKTSYNYHHHTTTPPYSTIRTEGEVVAEVRHLGEWGGLGGWVGLPLTQVFQVQAQSKVSQVSTDGLPQNTRKQLVT